MSYIFGGNTGLSYEDIQRRRQVADQLTSANARTPQNQWEGLHSIGRAIAARMIDRRASAAEEEGRSANSELMARIFGGMGGAATPATYSGGGQQGAPTFPDATPPATFTGPETAQDGTVMAFAASPAVASTSDAIGLPASLIQSESGGNFQAQNDVMGAGGQGHFGRGQFSRARLQDAMNAGVIPQGTTPEQFKASPAMQISVENWHRNDIMSRAEADGLMGYVGQDLNGDAPGGVVTPQGMLAVAHLGGYGGLNRFLKTGGAYNPSDAFGTSLFDYLDMHAGGGTAQPAAGGGGARPQATRVQAQQPQKAGPDLGLMIEALNSPYTSEGHRMVIAQLIERQLSGGAAADPMDALRLRQAEQDLELGAIELERARNPQAPERERIQDANGRWRYVDDGSLVFGDVEVQADPGFVMLTPDEVAQTPGLDPTRAYQRGPDGRVSQVGGGGVTVNNNAAPSPEPGDEKFAEATASQLATMFGTLQEQSLSANANLAQIGQLETLLDEGVGGGVDNLLSGLQRTFGVPISSGPVEAFNAIIAQLVPGQRVPGSGTMSDRDLELFKESLPRLINTPEGNRRILTAMRGLAEYQREQGRIANLAMTGQLSRQDAVAQLQALPNPLAEFSGGGGSAATSSSSDFSGMSADDLLAVDVMSIPLDQLDAYERALSEATGGTQ